MPKCTECGTTQEFDYASEHWGESAEVNDKLAAMQPLCFTCCFWMEYVFLRDAADVVRKDGKHMAIGPAGKPPWVRGCGGSRFEIRFSDGRVVTTDNLWHQGTIPDRFRERLPDNAVSVETLPRV